METADRLDIDLSAMWYNIVLMKIQSESHAYNEYSNSLIEVEKELEKFDDRMHLLVFDRNLEGKAFLIRAESWEELERIQKNLFGKDETNAVRL